MHLLSKEILWKNVSILDTQREKKATTTSMHQKKDPSLPMRLSCVSIVTVPYTIAWVQGMMLYVKRAMIKNLNYGEPI